MAKRKWFTRMAVAVAGLAAVVTLAAFRGGHGGFGGPEAFLGKRLDRMLDEVKATPEQKQQIRAITDALQEKGRAMRESHRGQHEQLLAQWEAGQLDRNQLMSQVDRHADEMKAFGHEFADAMVKVQGILTPEQRQQIAAKIREHKERGPRGGHGPRGPGPGAGAQGQ